MSLDHLLISKCIANFRSTFRLAVNSWRLSKEDRNSSVFIYPNPTGGKISVRYNVETEGTMIIFDEIGKAVLVMELDKNTNEATFDVSNLQNGVYSCKFTIDNKLQVKQLVVLH